MTTASDALTARAAFKLGAESDDARRASLPRCYSMTIGAIVSCHKNQEQNLCVLVDGVRRETLAEPEQLRDAGGNKLTPRP